MTAPVLCALHKKAVLFVKSGNMCYSIVVIITLYITEKLC